MGKYWKFKLKVKAIIVIPCLHLGFPEGRAQDQDQGLCATASSAYVISGSGGEGWGSKAGKE